MGFRRQTERHAEGVLPARRCVIACTAEGGHVGGSGRKRAGGDRAHSGHRRQSARQRVLALHLADPCGDIFDPSLCVAQLIGQHIQGRARCIGHVAGGVEKAIDVVDAFRHNDPELAQVRADRVYDLRPLPDQEVPCLVIEQGCLPLR